MNDDVQNIIEWSNRIHEWAVGKGWWKDGVENRDIAEIVSNFHSEISEAWEEYRAGRMNLWWKHKSCPDRRDGDKGCPNYLERERCSGLIADEWKPEGFYVEIADLCVRIMDTIGAYDWTIPLASDHLHRLNISIPQFIIDRHKQISDMIVGCTYRWSFQANYFAYWNISNSLETSRHNGVDLWRMIELKHEYNCTRPYRHGNKLA